MCFIENKHAPPTVKPYFLTYTEEYMNISEKIQKLNLPKRSYIVVGSGILNALAIRQSSDIDLIVIKNVYDKFENLGWDHGKWPDQVVMEKDVFELGTNWYGKNVDELLDRAEYIDNIPYLSLNDVYEWKKSLGREKDLNDLKLIDKYRLLSSKKDKD
jgi:hypothetical protein